MDRDLIDDVLERAEGIGIALIAHQGTPEEKAALIRDRVNALGHELHARCRMTALSTTLLAETHGTHTPLFS